MRHPDGPLIIDNSLFGVQEIEDDNSGSTSDSEAEILIQTINHQTLALVSS